MIHFEPVENKEIKERTGQTVYTEVKIIENGLGERREVGRVFSPAGSGNQYDNAIQVCGFSEAYDLWGCGVYEGYKDIQLLFDEGVMGGKSHNCDLRKCCRCYRHPCQCENKIRTEKIGDTSPNSPFNMKSSFDEEFSKRLKQVLR